MTPIAFKLSKLVEAKDLDQLNHVNNLRYIEWILETSELHWITKTSEKIRAKVGWVMIEQHIFYKRAAVLGDELELKTWIATAGGAKSVRKTQLFLKKTGTLLVEAETLWCFVQLEDLRPRRISQEIIEPYFY